MNQIHFLSLYNSGSGVIVIQLGQPYYIGSLRLLLWDCDSRTYSFYIETSINQKDWEIAVDKREEQLRSWQQFSFTPRPVVFFKIVGTYNTANEVGSSFDFELISNIKIFIFVWHFIDLSLRSFRVSITRFTQTTNRGTSTRCIVFCIINNKPIHFGYI